MSVRCMRKTLLRRHVPWIMGKVEHGILALSLLSQLDEPNRTEGRGVAPCEAKVRPLLSFHSPRDPRYRLAAVSCSKRTRCVA